MGRREAGQHRPAPPHQARQPPMLCLQGTRASQARGPWAATGHKLPHQCRRENPGPQLWPQAASCGGSHQHGDRPPPPHPTPHPPAWPDRALSGPPGSSAGRPEAVPSSSALGPLPVGPRGSSGCGLLFFNTLQISSTEGTISCDPVGRANGRRWDAQGNASRLCSALTEGSLFPRHKEGPPSKESLRPGQQGGGGGSPAPRGPRSVDAGLWRPAAQA